MTALLSEFLPYIIAGITAIAGVLGVYFKGKSSGARQKQSEIDRANAEARRNADQAKRDVEARDRDERREDLGKWSR